MTESLFLEEARYLLNVQYRVQMRRAVEAVPPERLWWRPNDGANSVGNLLLHLTGNVRQWILTGVAGGENVRDRPAEFAARSGATATELLADLEQVLSEIDHVLAGLNGETLAESRQIQGRAVTVLDAIFHVVEHFSYHLGQIVYITKLHAPGAIQFYTNDPDGLAHPVWKL